MSGGYKSLGYALVVNFIAWLPLVIVLAVGASNVQSGDEPPLVDLWILLKACGPLALPAVMWGLLYFPMGIALVALEESLNPLTVLAWIIKCMPDYLIFLVFLGCFQVPVRFLSLFTQELVLQMWPRAGVLPAILVAIAANQYSLVVTFTTLGHILRRKKHVVQWHGKSSGTSLIRDLQK